MSDKSRSDARQRAHADGLYPAPMSEGRSRNMRANRRADTKPEVMLRKELHRLGYRYRKDLLIRLDKVKVKPDIVFTARKVAVFVDGCFWHACPDHGRQPTVNEWYWSPKLRRNVERDKTVTAALRSVGWRVVRIWEHESLSVAITSVEEAVRASSEHGFESS